MNTALKMIAGRGRSRASGRRTGRRGSGGGAERTWRASEGRGSPPRPRAVLDGNGGGVGSHRWRKRLRTGTGWIGGQHPATEELRLTHGGGRGDPGTGNRLPASSLLLGALGLKKTPGRDANAEVAVLGQPESRTCHRREEVPTRLGGGSV